MEMHDILKSINSNVSNSKKLEAFNPHKNNIALRYILQGAFDDRIKSYLPEGIPPFVPIDTSRTVPLSLNNEHRTILNFFENTWGAKQPRLQQEQEFIKFLEKLVPDDVDIIIRMKDKTLHEKYKRLNKAIVKEMLKPWVPDLV